MPSPSRKESRDVTGSPIWDNRSRHVEGVPDMTRVEGVASSPGPNKSYTLDGRGSSSLRRAIASGYFEKAVALTNGCSAGSVCSTVGPSEME